MADKKARPPSPVPTKAPAGAVAKSRSQVLAAINFEVVWPNDSAAGAQVVTQFGILSDGGTPESPQPAGLYLVMGDVAPPPWFTDAARERGIVETKGQIHVQVRSAVYMTRVRAEELYEALGKHLGKGQPNA